MVNLGRLAVLVTALLWSAMAASQTLKMPSFCHVRDAIAVRFSLGMAALPAVERERVMLQFARIRNANYCPFGGVTVSGHTESLEGPTDKSKNDLAMERSRYVARLLEQGGMPKELIHLEASADRSPLVPQPDFRNARVEVTVRAGCPNDPCMFPVSENGLRRPQ